MSGIIFPIILQEIPVLNIASLRSETNKGIVVITFEDNGLGIELFKREEQVFWSLQKIFHRLIEGKGMDCSR
jgi:hypothetical protein